MFQRILSSYDLREQGKPSMTSELPHVLVPTKLVRPDPDLAEMARKWPEDLHGQHNRNIDVQWRIVSLSLATPCACMIWLRGMSLRLPAPLVILFPRL